LRPLSASRLAAVFLALVIAACGERTHLERLPREAVVLAFGDSLTYGTGAAESESYPAQLEHLIGRRVVRAGVPGEVTAQALERLPATLDQHAPRLLILCIGGNDFLRRLGNAQAERNVRAMIELARRRGIDVLLVGTPEPGLLPSPPAFYSAVAKQLHVPYEADVITEVLKDARLKSDPIHPNAAGYRVIAERVAAVLKKNGAL
jgi:acyl-CoA thioesterase I